VALYTRQTSFCCRAVLHFGQGPGNKFFNLNWVEFAGSGVGVP
jgi:hypothetical protein